MKETTLLNSKDKIKLYECCIPVKGVKRAIIYDLQRMKFDYIPLSLADILYEFDGKTISDIIQFYGKNNQDIIIEYFNFLLREEYVFFTKLDKNYFPKIEIKHEKPFKLSNIIIDIDEYTINNINIIYEQIESIGCESLLLRFLDNTNFEFVFTKVLKIFERSSLTSIEILCKDNSFLNEDFLNKFCQANMKIMKIVFFNSDHNDIKILKPADILLIKTKSNITIESPHIVSLNNFNVNIDLFMESKLYNNYYYKKIYIDKKGNIKNSPESTKVFGNIIKTKLNDIINNNEFKKIWNINKDSIKKCKDCEYRYMCVDSSNLSYNGELWELDNQCNYDPYNAKWESNLKV